MSRKSFIITALIINLTICLTLCIVMFTDRNRNDSTEKNSDKIKINQEENSGDIIMDNSETETTTLSEKSDNTESSRGSGQEGTQGSMIEGETTTKIIESQVGTDTQPITYKREDDSGETTSPPSPGQINPVETTPFTGTMAVINSSCNIRSNADVGGNVIGTANAGTSYRIEPTKCNSNWVAIYLDDSTLGYISTTFCSVS